MTCNMLTAVTYLLCFTHTNWVNKLSSPQLHTVQPYVNVAADVYGADGVYNLTKNTYIHKGCGLQ